VSRHDGSFGAVARKELAFLEGEYGFHLADEQDGCVRFESSSVVVTAVLHDGDQGHLDVTSALAGQNDQFATLKLSTMVGEAPVEGVLESVVEQLRRHQAALRGDESYYAHLGQAQRHESRKWFAYYTGQGPRPTGKLPRLH
jgi:hypothetical protein